MDNILSTIGEADDVEKNVASVFDRVIRVLDRLDVPYKILTGMDGQIDGIRWNNMFYLYAVNDEGIPFRKRCTKFTYIDDQLSVTTIEFSQVDEFIKQMESVET